MKASLLRWIGDADALRHIEQFGVREIPYDFTYQGTRKDDLYVALVGELFDRMRDGYENKDDWARLGNALAQYAVPDREEELRKVGVVQAEAALFSAAAFYCGGFPASAWVTMRSRGPLSGDDNRACFDLLARPHDLRSRLVVDLHAALLRGDADAIAAFEDRVAESAKLALAVGPDQWIPLELLKRLIAQFRTTNLRAILPDGTSPFWTPLIRSLVERGAWDFFPSQITAIQAGLLNRSETFSLQMPTGSGKTALCETLLFAHVHKSPNSAAVLIVPYRSLASELRYSLAKRLNEMGVSTRCAYGGTVPSGDEVRALDRTNALIATPETLSGILSANPTFAKRISLVICDEGHLLDASSRGISLELLLTRMKTPEAGTQRFVFMSAIVPNIQEINIWLGGTEETVVRSEYRPAVADFSVLRSVGRGKSAYVDLEMHPHQERPIRYRIERFLRHQDFLWRNPTTGKMNTYPCTSVKTLAVASARRALPMGAAVVFAANKRGDQGAIGLAEELLDQIEKGVQLPDPRAFSYGDVLVRVAEYLRSEYGEEWIGTRAIQVGAVLHHGDIPQETREVVEQLLRGRNVKFAICTSTLAEGVNLPIRTLVLYSVQRLGHQGKREDLLTRDIKNLVGRAGRAGATTKGLVICANEKQWPLVAAVAQQAHGEAVVGALRSFIEGVRRLLAIRNIPLTNELLERNAVFHSLVDGIDATLVDLAALEIGEEELRRLATSLADQTFASRQTDENTKQLLRNIFGLRAQRVAAIHAAGRLGWIRETGTRVRMIDLVENGLLPKRQRWDDVVDPVDPNLVTVMLEWAWTQRELQTAVTDAYRVGSGGDIASCREPFLSGVRSWLSGETFVRIAERSGLAVDDALGVHSHLFTYTLQTLLEQAVALLEKLLESRGQALAAAVLQFPEHLRFGAPTAAGCALAAGGLRHRRAYVALGNAPELRRLPGCDRSVVFSTARQVVGQDREGWRAQLGALVFENTLHDLATGARRNTD
jgi:superfamily II DNA/RNA helicase